jgi:hypothetical protein
MSLPAPFIPSTNNNLNINDRPVTTNINKITNNAINNYYIGHIYSIMSTIPEDYLFWFSQPPLKSLTITGESKSQILKEFRSAVLQSKLSSACILGIELHCSGYLQHVINILIEIIGSHVHIHNPNIGSRLIERYKKFNKQISLPSKNVGTIHFPDENDKHFFNRPEILGYRSTLNCQPIRNFVVEMITIITLSYQKEMTLPRINQNDVSHNYLYNAAKSLKIEGKNLMKVIMKNELQVVLQVIEKYLLHKNTKTEEVIYWILWLIKLESKIKKKGEKLPCKKLKIEGVPKNQTDHWSWYIWKSLFSRVSFCPVFKKKQIIDLYEIFKIDFTKTIVNQRMPILFFAIRLLKYDIANHFPSILNNLHVHVQAYSNVNTLYRNLQIKLARKSWVNVVGSEKVEETKPQKITKTMIKDMEKKKEVISLNRKMAYLDIIPKADTHF